ncbi:MAG: FliA/WhiG family RNA polymerase sigma factor [Proteobacteria bacterium]|nr:FliA/WhiG family RNA polymerase sigma factor [Desulfobacteraceae bacterium]MBU4001713.1 FliA/WhiG family RNA polymerase sigma factor [Pseudomonadota bacterium]MBU4054042.1 FliA/WhiG family RNA polymerase sigma factor [Pseudomonadota bacterium]MBU4316031.1 FliA/WhiG family RNA polymerase sigma factor [Pseudomonadota bacterium]MCG2752527.1 FliA/WhiG family RNA polymerase sigma factor [Desulfobacteraceae bacterium]
MTLATIRGNEIDSIDLKNRSSLILEYLPFVKQIVSRIASHLPPHVESEDLINAGVIGLMQAIDRFDPTRDNTLKTYASFRIKGAVLSELRSRDYLSRSHRKRIKQLDDAYLKLELQNEGKVEDEDVAKEIDVSLDEYYQIKAAANIYFVSIDEMDGSSNEEKENYVQSLIKKQPNDALTLTKLKEMQNAIEGAVDQLPDKEKLVLSMYYSDELTMKEIGRVMDLTESRVSQIHSQAIIHLRSRLRKDGLMEG